MGEPSGAVACGALSPTQGALVMSAMTDCVARAEGDGGMLAIATAFGKGALPKLDELDLRGNPANKASTEAALLSRYR